MFFSRINKIWKLIIDQIKRKVPLNKLTLIFLLITSLIALTIPSVFAIGISSTGKVYKQQVVVYGGTASGIMAAVAAARAGAYVALLEPENHLGGMVSSGLSVTDVGNSKIIGGLAKEFFVRAGNYYHKPIAFKYEPHIAEQVFNDMLSESNVKVYLNHRIKENDGVLKNGTNIYKITCENNASFTGHIFIDCTYEGDLMAESGTSFTWGRESSNRYHESLAGIRPYSPKNNFKPGILAYDRKNRLLPGITSRGRGPLGSGDYKIQAYNYRLLLTNDPKKSEKFLKPDNYNADNYIILLNYINELEENYQSAKLSIRDLFSVIPIQNNKFDINNKGPFSTDYIGGSWDYPNADYAGKEKIRKEHKEYIQGLFYFLSNDSRVPLSLRNDMRKWGLSKDEFIDNGYWPYQLYIRESRRMLGQYVMTQKDIETELKKPDSIGMGSYNTDSHNTQRYVTEEGFVLNEGDIQIKVKPYQIPYGIILPKPTETSNLLVPVCFSASHVACSSLRMEAQYMILGQAAGEASKLAIDENTQPAGINISVLKQRLRANGAILEHNLLRR